MKNAGELSVVAKLGINTWLAAAVCEVVHVMMASYSFLKE
jgi:hypothetical protein